MEYLYSGLKIKSAFLYSPYFINHWVCHSDLLLNDAEECPSVDVNYYILYIRHLPGSPFYCLYAEIGIGSMYQLSTDNYFIC